MLNCITILGGGLTYEMGFIFPILLVIYLIYKFTKK